PGRDGIGRRDALAGSGEVLPLERELDQRPVGVEILRVLLDHAQVLAVGLGALLGGVAGRKREGGAEKEGEGAHRTGYSGHRPAGAAPAARSIAAPGP